MFGFGKGFSATFYGSIFYGFIYFYLYKQTKLLIYKHYGDDTNPKFVFVSAAIIAEALTLIFGFPFDLIKCRL